MAKEMWITASFSDEHTGDNRFGPFDEKTASAVSVALAGREDVTGLRLEEVDE